MSRHTITKKIFSAFVTAISCGAFFVNNPLFAMNEEDVVSLINNKGFNTYVGTKENGFSGRKEFISPSGLVVDQSLQFIREATDEDIRELKKHPLVECYNEESKRGFSSKTAMLKLTLPAGNGQCIIVKKVNDYPRMLARITNDGNIDWVDAMYYCDPLQKKGPSYFYDSDLKNLDGKLYYDLEANNCWINREKCIQSFRSYGIPGFESKKCFMGACIAF